MRPLTADERKRIALMMRARRAALRRVHRNFPPATTNLRAYVVQYTSTNPLVPTIFKVEDLRRPSGKEL